MRYWWVNQNQTYRQEIAGGYLWSPKRKRDGSMNPFYEFMRAVAPGDLVFSFADTRIKAFGVVRSHAYEAPKPAEFGAAGRHWDEIGWRVDVGYREIDTVFRPAQWMEVLGPLLPERYAPLRPNGHGMQTVYLTSLPRAFALQLADLIGRDLGAIARAEAVADARGDDLPARPAAETVLWEEHLRRLVEEDGTLAPTDKEALIVARRGQGLFRERVQRLEKRCRITRVDRAEHLRASHCKPWRDATNAERLDGENGLLLTPSIDHLFDRGFISFRDDGRLLVSPTAHRGSLERMGVPTDRDVDAGDFTRGQTRYLEYHRDSVFLASKVTLAN